MAAGMRLVPVISELRYDEVVVNGVSCDLSIFSNIYTRANSPPLCLCMDAYILLFCQHFISGILQDVTLSALGDPSTQP